jgi:DNA-binding transcriptional regulator YhcF (GntR family)
MPRPVSQKVADLKILFRQRIAHGVYPPGAAFPSTRAIVKRHTVSYQTAHRIINQLVDEGLLQTRRGAGTFVTGGIAPPTGALLLFNPRAKRKGSIGAHLKKLLETELDQQAIPHRTAWTDAGLKRHPNFLPVFWERHPTTPLSPSDLNFALVLNDRKTVGLEASRLDTLSIDNYSGGVCAAEVLLAQEPLRANPSLAKRVTVMAARQDDARSFDRVAGLRSLITIPNRRVIEAGSWDMEDSFNAAGRLLSLNPSAVFCCSDRLAEGVIRYARKPGAPLPPIVGFDNAPIAETLGLTTIAAPWQEMAETAAKRMKGNRGTARRQIFAPHPVIR